MEMDNSKCFGHQLRMVTSDSGWNAPIFVKGSSAKLVATRGARRRLGARTTMVAKERLQVNWMET